jgi:hypothetical protein
MNTATLERPQQGQLEYTTITVAYVNEPKPGQKSASIKDVDGVYYWIKPAEQRNYQPGASYEVGFATTQSNGYTNRLIKSAAPVQPRQPAPQRAQPMQAREPVQRSEPIPAAQPAHGANHNGNGYYRPTSPRDARRMFICSQMNAIITSRQVQLSADAIADAIRMLSDAYDATLGTED